MSPSNLTEWSTEARTSLSFKVNERAVENLLPPGWKSAPSSLPVSLGANLTITLMDRILVHDAAGQPKGTGTTRYLVVSTGATDPARGWTGTTVIGGISPEGRGVYDVYLAATEVSVTRSSSANLDEGGTADHSHNRSARGSPERSRCRRSE